MGSWNPSWSIEAMLVGLISFFLDHRMRDFVGAESESSSTRRKLADLSWSFNASDATFCELFPGFCKSRASASGSAAPKAAPVQTPSEHDSLSEDPSHSTNRVEHSQSIREDLPECAFCRGQKDEPLIRACACRGSIGSVHASCLYAWIQRHREDDWNQGPRCGICLQPYAGTDIRPGLSAFVRFHVQRVWGCVPLCLTWMTSCAAPCCKVALRMTRFLVLLTCYAFASGLGFVKTRVPSVDTAEIAFVLRITFGAYVLYTSLTILAGIVRARRHEVDADTIFLGQELYVLGFACACVRAMVLVETLPLGCLLRLPLEQAHLRQTQTSFCTQELCMNLGIMAPALVLLLVAATLNAAIEYRAAVVVSWVVCFRMAVPYVVSMCCITPLPFMYWTVEQSGRSAAAMLHALMLPLVAVACACCVGVVISGSCMYYDLWQSRHSSFTLTEPLLADASGV